MNTTHRIIAGARVCAAALLILAAIAWEHRAQIRAALATAIAAAIVAAELTYRAGRWTHRVIHRLSTRSVALLPVQPLPALAPITATLAAAREALERLVRRLYPTAA